LDRASPVGTAKNNEPASATVTSASPAAFTNDISIRAARPDCSAPSLRAEARSRCTAPEPTARSFTIPMFLAPRDIYHDHERRRGVT
jgi:hypothetical protein